MGRQLLLWLVLGGMTGTLVGGVVTYFLKFLFWSINQTGHASTLGTMILLPLGGLVTGVLIHYGAPDAAGHGTEAVIRAVHRQSGKINWKVAPIKALATISSIAPGGSAGKEGPSAQIGAAIASALADFFRFTPAQRQRIVICGIGAGFAAVFGTPVAGAILGIEVLAIGDLLYDMLLPSFSAAIMAYLTSQWLGLTWNYPSPHTIPHFGLSFFGRTLVIGIAAGLAAYLLVFWMDGLHHVMARIKGEHHWWPPLFPTIAGVALAVLILVAGRAYGGLSLSLLSQALSGTPVPHLAFLWKILFVGITLGFGMSGGIITPLFVIGATLGSLLAAPLGLPLSVGADIGLVGVTAAGANAPIAAIFMGLELFGAKLAPEFLTAAVSAFILIGNHSVYPSQRVHLQKSPWAPIKTGVALEDADMPADMDDRPLKGRRG